MQRLSRPVVLLGIALATGSCAVFGGRQYEQPGSTSVRELTLQVENLNFYDATLYAVGTGYRMRLGRVPGTGEETFVFRWAPMDLWIEIELLSVGSHVTPSLAVDEGDELELKIEPGLHLRIKRQRPSG